MPIQASNLNFNHERGADPSSQGCCEHRWKPTWTGLPWPVTRGPVVDSVDETFLGSQVQLDTLKDYPFMHWIPGAEPATAGVRVLARL